MQIPVGELQCAEDVRRDGRTGISFSTPLGVFGQAKAGWVLSAEKAHEMYEAALQEGAGMFERLHRRADGIMTPDEGDQRLRRVRI